MALTTVSRGGFDWGSGDAYGECYTRAMTTDIATAPAPNYDWGAIEGTAVRRLRGKKIRPVPEALVRQAQRSWDGVEVIDEQSGEVYTEHALRFRFESPERAAEFADLMRAAGDHTSPPTSVSVKIDPDKTKDRPVVDPSVVEWKAGRRRTRRS